MKNFFAAALLCIACGEPPKDTPKSAQTEEAIPPDYSQECVMIDSLKYSVFRYNTPTSDGSKELVVRWAFMGKDSVLIRGREVVHSLGGPNTYRVVWRPLPHKEAFLISASKSCK